MIRARAHVSGVVQGVGFRPFVHRVAARFGLVGFVQNGADGAHIEAQGDAGDVDRFFDVIRAEAPPPARVDRVVTTPVPLGGETAFGIAESRRDAPKRPVIPADLAVCEACLAEVSSPDDRRYRYPFTSCARCGPRFTIIEQIPYDRPSTTMAAFALCAACAREYADPGDRRFHAEPIACPACGPVLRAVSPGGAALAEGQEALTRAAAALAEGRIVALEGLGGYQLLADASSDDAVALLRARKHRDEKPFAVMFPSIEAARGACEITPAIEALLTSPEAPIVLVRKRDLAPAPISRAVAPENPYLGAMIPSTPLHHLVLSSFGGPLVCTSGNLSEEPMCVTGEEALSRLGGIADLFLAHDRAIVRPVDDSVVRVGPKGPVILRRARGYAPLAQPFPFPDAPVILALGGHQKSTIALAKGGEVTVSQHLGDLSSVEGALLLERTVADWLAFFGAAPEVIACDRHPDYESSKLARRLAAELGARLVTVQHHHAHVASCMAEHGLKGPVLGLAWDGAGLGDDGALWGGEALVVSERGCRRAAHLRPFSLPGGERAVREPARAAFGALYEMGLRGLDAHLPSLSPQVSRVLATMIDQGLNAPRTTSAGRLFDAIAAIAGVRERAGFEGQAAMLLEWAAERASGEQAYPLPLRDGDPMIGDWAPLVLAALEDRRSGRSPSVIAARFHGALAGLAADVATRTGIDRVALSGGCFQNEVLTARVTDALAERGFMVYAHARFPPNDGGLSLGQAYVAARSSTMGGG